MDGVSPSDEGDELELTASGRLGEAARCSMSTSGPDAVAAASLFAAPGANSTTVSSNTHPHPCNAS